MKSLKCTPSPTCAWGSAVCVCVCVCVHNKHMCITYKSYSQASGGVSCGCSVVKSGSKFDTSVSFLISGLKGASSCT